VRSQVEKKSIEIPRPFRNLEEVAKRNYIKMKKEGKNPTKKPPEIRATQCQTTKKGKSDDRKSLNDYNYYIGSATQASDYETTTEYVINYIKKTFDYGNDIGTELKELTPIDKET
jgi:hypothetical protein